MKTQTLTPSRRARKDLNARRLAALTKTRTRYRRLEAGEALIPGDEYRMNGFLLTDGRKISTGWMKVKPPVFSEVKYVSHMFEYRRPIPHTPTAEERIWVEANRLCAVALRPSTPLREKRNARRLAALMRVAASFLALHTNPRHPEP